MTGQYKTTSRLATHLIYTSLGADLKPKAVRLKNAPIGHQPSALAALSISNVALVGLSPIARFLRCTLNRGVR